MRYAASLVDNHGTQVVKIFAQVLEKGRFVRDFEKLNRSSSPNHRLLRSRHRLGTRKLRREAPNERGEGVYAH